jgi:flavin reductase (DIM6/NTAB) family NADH-FMN oxidoreductase RutF
MFYSTEKRDHGLRHDPFKALVVPRPIGWVSTLDDTGTPNLAPFSFFNAISDSPPMLMFSIANGKDSLLNIQATKECTCSMASNALVDEMNMSSAAVKSGVNEFELAKLESAASTMVAPERVAASPAAFECRLWKTIELPVVEGRTGYTTVIVSVEGIYVDDRFIADGMVDVAAMAPLARLGYMDYAVVNEKNMFSLNRPQVSENGTTATLKSGPWDGGYR